MSEEKAPYGKPSTMDKILKIKVIREDADVTVLEGKSSRFYFDPNTRNGEELDNFLAGCEEVENHSELKSVAEGKIKVKMKFKDAPIGARFQFTDSEDTYIKLHSNGDGLIVKWNGAVEGLQSHCCWIDEENDIDFNTVIEVF